MFLGNPGMSRALHVGRCRLGPFRQGPLFGWSFDDSVAFNQSICPNGMFGFQRLI